jgi:uncharacterized membrane protein YoaK (UPF0700 family)
MPEPFDTSSDSARELRVADSLIPAMLLAVTGGGLDAFVFLNHGHVFAAAMTGNFVFLGIALLAHNRHEVILHTLPLITFACGIFASNFLTNHLKHHAVIVGLICEILVFFIASWLPGSFPESLFIMTIAFAGAYQVGSFRTAGTYAYNSTFMTGNIRSAVDGLYQAFNPATRESGLRQCRALSLIILSFMIGTFAGAVLAPRLLNHTLWFLDLPLLIVLGIVLRSSSIPETQKEGGP